MASSIKSNDDCYFYYYSSCTKGDECPYRHCELALGTETVCVLWKEGQCFRANCKFRHMESRINRTRIPCYWESQPGGCRKPHCVFFHRKLKNGPSLINTSSALILPTTDGKTSPKLPEEPKLAAIVPAAEVVVNSPDVSDPDTSSAPVQPFVLNFDEESDNESLTSTPVKTFSDGNTGSNKNGSSTKHTVKSAEKDFGIKTLEQIRMEKIHKESDGFYSTAYDSPMLNASQSKEHLSKECYPPQSEFISLTDEFSHDKTIPASNKDLQHSSLEEESDLRSRLLNRRNVSPASVNQAKRVINFKKQPTKTEVAPKRMDFKIKTLEEIRKEKENKQAFSTVPDGVKTSNNGLFNATRKLKITRRSAELYNKSSAEDKIETLSSSDVNMEDKSNLESSETSLDEHPTSPPKKETENSAIKRRADDVSERPSKVIKLNSLSSGAEDVKSDHAPNVNGMEYGEVEKPSVNSVQPLRCSQTIVSPSKQLQLFADTQADAASSTKAAQDAPSRGAETNSPSIPDDTCSVTSTSEPPPSKGEETEAQVRRSISVDEFEQLLHSDVNMDDLGDTTPADDILLEIEQFLDS